MAPLAFYIALTSLLCAAPPPPRPPAAQCDLAGSERVRRTSSKGTRLEEARAINASLHTLGQVIAALSVVSMAPPGGGGKPLPHVPWRDSKLTRLLFGNLGGAANTYLLATVGPGR